MALPERSHQLNRGLAQRTPSGELLFSANFPPLDIQKEGASPKDKLLSNLGIPTFETKTANIFGGEEGHVSARVAAGFGLGGLALGAAGALFYDRVFGAEPTPESRDISSVWPNSITDKTLQPIGNSDSMKPSPTPESPTPTPTLVPTETPKEQPTPISSDAARKRLEDRIRSIQNSSAQTPQPTETPTPPPPTETLTPPTQTPEATPSPEIKKPHVVRPVLFVPADLSEQVDDLDNINKAMEQVQRFFAEQLNGRTFEYEKATLIRGQKDLKYYCPKSIAETQCIKNPSEPEPNLWDTIHKIRQDIEQQDPTLYSKTKGLVIVTFWAGGGGTATGPQLSKDDGFVLLGQCVLDSVGRRNAKGTDSGACDTDKYAEHLRRDNPQVAAHEFGHALGVPHPKDDGSKEGDKNYWRLSIMDACDWPKCIFLDSPTNPEKQKLLQSPFIK